MDVRRIGPVPAVGLNVVDGARAGSDNLPMAVLEIAKALLGIVDLYDKLTEGREGDAAEQRATVALVAAVMHREVFAVATSYQADGIAAAVTNTTTQFEFTVADASVEVGVLGDGLLIKLGGDLAGLVPIRDRIQHVPVPSLAFDASLRLGRELLARLVAVLEAARRALRDRASARGPRRPAAAAARGAGRAVPGSSALPRPRPGSG